MFKKSLNLFRSSLHNFFRQQLSHCLNILFIQKRQRGKRFSTPQKPFPDWCRNSLAKQHFDALPETSQEEVPEASKKKLREAILSLPQVQTEVSGNLQLNDQSLLLDNMTSADVQKLYQNDRSFKIEVVAADTRPDRGEAKAIEGQLHGATIYKNIET